MSVSRRGFLRGLAGGAAIAAAPAIVKAESLMPVKKLILPEQPQKPWEVDSVKDDMLVLEFSDGSSCSVNKAPAKGLLEGDEVATIKWPNMADLQTNEALYDLAHLGPVCDTGPIYRDASADLETRVNELVEQQVKAYLAYEQGLNDQLREQLIAAHRESHILRTELKQVHQRLSYHDLPVADPRDMHGYYSTSEYELKS